MKDTGLTGHFANENTETQMLLRLAHNRINNMKADP